jgi:hypothetical protein
LVFSFVAQYIFFFSDKTLNVVDIVNSLDEDFCSPQMFGNYRSPASKSPNKISSLNVKSTHSPNPEQIVYPRKTTRDSVANQNLFEDESTIEEQEESHILEDIFFLK